jgi:hypothetical protein
MAARHRMDPMILEDVPAAVDLQIFNLDWDGTPYAENSAKVRRTLAKSDREVSVAITYKFSDKHEIDAKISTIYHFVSASAKSRLESIAKYV